MSDWTIPDWPEPFTPAFEVPILRRLAEAASNKYSDLVCQPNFEVKGCAFLEFYRQGTLICRTCVTEGKDGLPLFSAYLGKDEDEFHGFNQQAIIQLLNTYHTELPSD